MKHKLQAGAGIGTLHFPEHYFPADGYAGVHDDIHAKALLLVQGAQKGGIVTLELPSVRPWELTDALRAYAAELLHVPYANLWLIMTHDLSAPHVPASEEGRRLHMDVLKAAVKTACEAALAGLQDVTAVYCEGFCDVNANRDMQSADGWWVGIHGDGPSDKTLSMLRFDADDGKPAAVLYSYSLKSSVLEETIMSDGKRYASGDITGMANAKAEDVLGCPVLFVMGAAGEQVPKKKANYLELDEKKHFYRVNLAEKGYEILEELSDELADALCRTAAENCDGAASPTVPENPRGTALTPLLRFGQMSFHADGQVSYPKTLPQPPVLHFDYIPTAGEDIPVWYMQIGEAVMLGVKPEITTPIFDVIRQESVFPYMIMATLVNGGQGYIATDSDYARYTYPGLKTPFRQGTDAVFIREVDYCLKALSEDK